MEIENVIIIGSGPAGYTAALYTSRESFEPLLITGTAVGGQLELTTDIENFPGFPDGIGGHELMEVFKKQAVRFGTRLVTEEVIEVDFSSRPFKVKTPSREYQTKSIIIATGASAKWLGIESERQFISKGVSSCATCDAPFFKNKDVVVVGGGDTAMEDSLFLTKFAKSVTILHRRDSFRCSQIMKDRVMKNEKIRIKFNTIVDEILGDKKVSGIRIKNIETNNIEQMPIDGVFIAIGYTPNTKFLEGKLELDKQGYIVTKEEIKTSIDGIFVAGDVADKIYRQAVTAAGSGTKAALEVRNYLQNMKD